MFARIVPIISISSVPAESEKDKVLEASSFASSNLISSPSDRIKKSSSEYPIFASKKSLWKVIDTSPSEPVTSASKIRDMKSRSAVTDFKTTLFPVYSIL